VSCCIDVKTRSLDTVELAKDLHCVSKKEISKC
jgi:hypothetical protein